MLNMSGWKIVGSQGTQFQIKLCCWLYKLQFRRVLLLTLWLVLERQYVSLLKFKDTLIPRLTRLYSNFFFFFYRVRSIENSMDNPFFFYIYIYFKLVDRSILFEMIKPIETLSNKRQSWRYLSRLEKHVKYFWYISIAFFKSAFEYCWKQKKKWILLLKRNLKLTHGNGNYGHILATWYRL